MFLGMGIKETDVGYAGKPGFLTTPLQLTVIKLVGAFNSQVTGLPVLEAHNPSGLNADSGVDAVMAFPCKDGTYDVGFVERNEGKIDWGLYSHYLTYHNLGNFDANRAKEILAIFEKAVSGALAREKTELDLKHLEYIQRGVVTPNQFRDLLHE
jgi:hypothetical protein